MAKILFSNSYFYKFDSKQWEGQQPYPPYGTIYAANFIRNDGHDVAVFDCNLIDSVNDIIPTIEKTKPKYFVIYEDGFNYLTKMCLTVMREAAFELSKIAKEHNAIVIVSSSDSTDHFDKYLENGADFVMLGEAELTLQELINELEKGSTSFDHIKGVAYKKDGAAKENFKRPVLRELDSLGQPAWDLIDVEPYRKIWEKSQGFFSLNIATTRGCPYKCNWCAKPIYGNRYNTRSPKNVVDEIEMLINTYNVRYFWVCDDIFGLKPNWVQEFRDLVKERKLDFKYKIQSRVDLLLKEDSITALADSGLHEVWVGAESGSQRILDMMDKGTQLEQVYTATKMLKKHNVRVAFFLQFGYMDESRSEIDQTIKMVEELVPDDIGISVSYPLPGTKFYEMVKDQMLVKQNWKDSDDLEMMYKGSFDSAFYKRLHRYVHKCFKKAKGFESWKMLFNSPFQLSKKQILYALAIFYYIPATLVDQAKLKKLEKS